MKDVPATQVGGIRKFFAVDAMMVYAMEAQVVVEAPELERIGVRRKHASSLVPVPLLRRYLLRGTGN